MLRLDPEIIGLSAIAAGECSHAFSSYLPSAWTTRALVLKGNPDCVDEQLADWRVGYIPATRIALLVGGGISLFSRSPLPAAAAVLMAVAMIHSYESTLPVDLRRPALPTTLSAIAGAVGLPSALARPMLPEAQITRVEVLRGEEAFGAPGV